jgi:hypothetical protein
MSAVPVEVAARDARTRRAGTTGVLPRLVGATVCLLPFLSPAGPGNTAPMDLGILATVVLALLWVTREQLPVVFPYAVGVGGLVIGGALAALVTDAPLASLLPLVQDLVLLLWATALALGRHDPAIIAAVTRAWAISAPIYAAVMVVAYLFGVGALTGVSPENGVRASYTFGDPNLAANYLVISLFVMAACRRPRARAARLLGYTAVVLAITFTGSNGAYLTLALGTVVACVLGRYRGNRPVAAVLILATATTATVVAAGVVVPHVDLDALQARAAASVPLLRDSVARSGASSHERTTITHEGMQTWFAGYATGYGPGRTKTTLGAGQAPYPKEAHSDYLATLIERGFVGALGLIVLLCAVGSRCVRLVTGTLPAPYAEIVPRWWLLAGIAPVMAVAGTFYEVLHFRHLWTWLGLVAALVLVLRDRERS